MAKPVLVVYIRESLKTDEILKLEFVIKQKTNEDYHVLIVAGIQEQSEVCMFNCFNDCKGLQDEDIESLIKTVNERVITDVPAND